MKKQILFIGGLILTILGLMGIISKWSSQISSYIVFGLGLALLVIYYLTKSKD